MIIELANSKDAEEILALQKLCYQSEAEIYNDYDILPLKQTLKSIKSDFKDYHFLKPVENHRIIGSVRARISHPGTCYIGRLMVHPDFQNQGIGTQLMNEIEEIFHEYQKWELITGHLSEKMLNFIKNVVIEYLRRKNSTIVFI